MTAQVSINPLVTTTAAGLFNTTSRGFIQGFAIDDPVIRYQLVGGVLASTETLPMWGGVAISEYIPKFGTTLSEKSLGPAIVRATSLSSTIPLTGFSVFGQAHAAINSPQSQVPLIPTGGHVNFYRLGSRARIVVACDPSLVSLEGGLINANVSWDFNDSMLQPYVASGATEAVTSMTWSSTNGGQVAVVMTGAAIYAKVGDIINVSGVTNTGTGAVGLINTAQTINTWTDSTHFTFLLPGTSTLWGTFGGTIVLNVGTGALAVKILYVNVGNCLTVNYNASNTFANWNTNGSCAVIEI
jgi:hypothetical protein